MRQSVAIRDADLQDAALLARIIGDSFRDVARRFALTPENCPRHPSNCTPAWIDADHKRGVRYFILSENGEPVGCVGLESPNPQLCYLERLCVLPEMRRRGCGRALVLHALKCARANAAGRVGIGIIADQTDLKEWYSKLGFSETHRKRFPHLPFEVLFMELKISSPPSGDDSSIES